jgi:hypothetical protein
MAKSLRGYVDQLRTRDDFIEIDKPVRPHEFEVTAILKQLEDSGRTPAVSSSIPPISKAGRRADDRCVGEGNARQRQGVEGVPG